MKKIANATIPDFHRVRRNETLYSIAWRYGIDYRELASLNKLDHRYRIYPGQKILLQNSDSQRASDFDSQKLLAAVHKVTGTKQTKKNSTISGKTTKNRQNTSSSYSKTASLTPKSTSYKLSTSSQKPYKKSSSISSWIWPVQGDILKPYSTKPEGNKGLDIKAKLGDPVRAAANGKVVYQGNGLRGYGHLVIIKHNDDYLSAYAHNSRIHVKENEIVKAGQIIADIGNSGTDKEKLHFEIRFRGQPVNPLKYLPGQ